MNHGSSLSVITKRQINRKQSTLTDPPRKEVWNSPTSKVSLRLLPVSIKVRASAPIISLLTPSGNNLWPPRIKSKLWTNLVLFTNSTVKNVLRPMYESKRALRTRVGEHKIPSNTTSPVAQHAKQSKHRIDWSNVKVLDQDSNYFSRGVRDAINIYRHSSSLNRDKGRHQLPPMYQSILYMTVGQQGHVTIKIDSQSTSQFDKDTEISCRKLT